MTQHFRAALIAVGVLAVATAAIWLVLGSGGKDASRASSFDDGLRSPADGTEPGGVRLAPGGSDPGDTTGFGRPGGVGPGVHGDSASGLHRTPEGIDLSDPDQLREALARVISDRPIDWIQVARLVAVLDGPLPDDMRAALLRALETGNRVGAIRVLAVLRDGSFVRDLLVLLDNRRLSPDAYNAILQALAILPGANDAEVVRALEARLVGNGRKDRAALLAIGKRGGRDAARAIVEYLLRCDDPVNLPNYGFLGLDLARDTEAAEVVAEALAVAATPEALRALIRLSARGGANAMVASLIAFDHADQPQEVRREVIEALGRIGTEDALAYLMQVGRQPGTYGDLALTNIGRIASATPEARAGLVAALERVDENPRPQKARREILRALGNLGEPAAMGAMAEALTDPDPLIRQVGARGLGNIGLVAEPHIPALIDAFSTGDEALQRGIAIALGGIGGDEARGTLQQMVGNENLSGTVRRSARMALQRLEIDEEDAEQDARLGGK